MDLLVGIVTLVDILACIATSMDLLVKATSFGFLVGIATLVDILVCTATSVDLPPGI